MRSSRREYSKTWYDSGLIERAQKDLGRGAESKTWSPSTVARAVSTGMFGKARSLSGLRRGLTVSLYSYYRSRIFESSH